MLRRAGILIMMTCHRIKRDASWGGLWIGYGYDESMINEAWTRLMHALCKQWNVFAVDLKNEPVEASWGIGRHDNDWGEAAARIGNHVRALNPVLSARAAPTPKHTIRFESHGDAREVACADPLRVSSHAHCRRGHLQEHRFR